MTSSEAPHEHERDLEVLDPTTCWTLLDSHVVGRLAISRPQRSPLVLPVNYLVEPDHQLVIRTGSGAKLDAAQHGLVALEVDELDPVHHVGWSVVVEGLAQVTTEDATEPEVDTWAPGHRPHVIRIQPTQITGRRIRLTTPETDPRGYR